MTLRFLDLAQRELDDAVAWYNEREAGLGLDFLDELDRYSPHCVLPVGFD